MCQLSVIGQCVLSSMRSDNWTWKDWRQPEDFFSEWRRNKIQWRRAKSSIKRTQRSNVIGCRTPVSSSMLRFEISSFCLSVLRSWMSRYGRANEHLFEMCSVTYEEKFDKIAINNASSIFASSLVLEPSPSLVIHSTNSFDNFSNTTFEFV